MRLIRDHDVGHIPLLRRRPNVQPPWLDFCRCPARSAARLHDSTTEAEPLFPCASPHSRSVPTGRTASSCLRPAPGRRSWSTRGTSPSGSAERSRRVASGAGRSSSPTRTTITSEPSERSRVPGRFQCTSVAARRPSFLRPSPAWDWAGPHRGVRGGRAPGRRRAPGARRARGRRAPRAGSLPGRAGVPDHSPGRRRGGLRRRRDLRGLRRPHGLPGLVVARARAVDPRPLRPRRASTCRSTRATGPRRRSGGSAPRTRSSTPSEPVERRLPVAPRHARLAARADARTQARGRARAGDLRARRLPRGRDPGVRGHRPLPAHERRGLRGRAEGDVLLPGQGRAAASACARS